MEQRHPKTVEEVGCLQPVMLGGFPHMVPFEPQSLARSSPKCLFTIYCVPGTGLYPRNIVVDKTGQVPHFVECRALWCRVEPWGERRKELQ